MAMGDEYRQILRIVSKDLVKDMEPEEVLSSMAVSLVFNQNDESTIKSKTTREDKIKALLEILPRRGAKAYESFKTALQHSGQLFLANILTEAENKMLTSELKRERIKSAGLKKQLSEQQPSTKDRETTNSPESELNELRSNDLQEDEKHCPQCHDREMENDALREKVKELHDILSHFEVKHVEEKELFEKAKRCTKEVPERHEKEETKEAIGLNGQTGERAEEIQSKHRNDKESLKAEKKSQIIKLEQAKGKLEEEENRLASEVDAKESEVREIKNKLEEKEAECKDIAYEHFLKCDEVAKLRRAPHILKSRTEKYIPLPCGYKRGLGNAADVLAYISYKTGRAAGVIDDSSCVIIDLGENYRLFPTHFALEESVRFSILQGRTDDSQWVELKIAKAQLAHSNYANDLRIWLVEIEVSAFRYLRIFQTDDDGKWWPYHPSTGLELYGVLLELSSIGH